MKRIVILLTLVFIWGSAAHAKCGDVVHSFNAPSKYMTGLTFDGKSLWAADRKSDLLYKIDPESGKVLKTISSPGYWPLGLAWDGKYLWNIDRNAKKIFQLDPNTGWIVHSFDFPTPSPQGITFDGIFLWISDRSTHTLNQISPDDGTTIRSIPAPTSRPNGLTFDGKYLWVTDRLKNEIYMVYPETGDVIMVLPSPGPYPNGLAWDAHFIWNVDYETNKIYRLKLDNTPYSLQNERDAEITVTHITRNQGPGTIHRLNVIFAIPQNLPQQKIVGSISYSPKSPKFVTDQWGEKFAEFDTKELPAEKTKEDIMKVKAKIYDIRYYIFPERVGSLNDIPDAVKDHYLADGEKYQIHDPYFRKIVKQVVGDETNAYWVARKIFSYVIDHMHYELSGGWNVAPTVLKRGSGSCSEYTFVYVALCRAAGLPARYQGSVVVRGDNTSFDDVFHRWAEVYLPNYGWVPVDPSGGDQRWGRDQANFFGHLSNRFLITTINGGGSKDMGWTYNTNEHWVSDPKTEVKIETVADWVSTFQK
ncbi:virginiamycin B lyase [bacterium BMS3Abin05]|nr:virginiamycin B lyase [bacterium BMS3Abin05]